MFRLRFLAPTAALAQVLLASCASVMPTAAQAQTVCEVAAPTVCAIPGSAPARPDAPATVSTLPATTAAECFKGAQDIAAACAGPGPKREVLARFTDGPAETLRRVGRGGDAKEPPSPLPLPIVYGKAFENEFDQFGYNPRYAPGPVSVGAKGRLMVRSGDYLQFRGDGGRWTHVNLADAARSAIEAMPDVAGVQWAQSIRSTFSDRSVYEDADGRLYTLVQGHRTRLKGGGVTARPYLLASTDAGATWQAVALPVADNRPSWRAVMEHNDGNNDRSSPPPVLVFDQDDDAKTRSATLDLVTLRWASGRLTVHQRLPVSSKSLLVEAHSGGANSLVSTADHIYIAYPGDQAPAGRKGTPAYVVTVDKARGQVLGETLLGDGGDDDKVDNHNIPGLCLAPGGEIHALMPGHQDDVKMATGRLRGAAIEWGATQTIGERKDRSGGYTYVALACDRRGQISIAMRWAGDGYRFRLVFLQRDERGQWARYGDKAHKVLLDPGRPFYGGWRHKLAQAADGTLYLFYNYYGNQFTADELAAVMARFPFESWLATKEATPARCVRGAERRCWLHPVPELGGGILQSSDGGRNWSFLP